MRRLKLMADYRCFPLWSLSPGDYENISPDTLPISSSLRAALHMWANEFDQTLDSNDPASAGFETQAKANAFIALGASLLLRLRSELGPAYQVDSNLRVEIKTDS